MTREQALKAELLILTKLGQLEGRRNRAIEHSFVKHNEKYDAERAKFLEKHPSLEAILVNDKDSDHAAYLQRVAERAAKQPELPGVDTAVTEE